VPSFIFPAPLFRDDNALPPKEARPFNGAAVIALQLDAGGGGGANSISTAVSLNGESGVNIGAPVIRRKEVEPRVVLDVLPLSVPGSDGVAVPISLWGGEACWLLPPAFEVPGRFAFRIRGEFPAEMRPGVNESGFGFSPSSAVFVVRLDRARVNDGLLPEASSEGEIVCGIECVRDIPPVSPAMMHLPLDVKNRRDRLLS
jgi:hypothetical protein